MSTERNGAPWHGSGSRNLVLARVGDRSMHGVWVDPHFGVRDWDLHLSYYGSGDRPQPCHGDHVTWTRDPERSKFYGISAALERSGVDLDAYDYIAIPDDDLIMTARDWNAGFALVRRHGLQAAQFSLNPYSYFGHLDTVRRPGLELRYVPLIELMAPILSVDAFRRCLPYFRDHDNIWAMDHVLASCLQDRPRSMAVLDAVSVLHTRPFWSGPMYDSIRDTGRDPHVVERLFLERRHVSRVERRMVGAITRRGREIARFRRDPVVMLWPRLLRKVRTLLRAHSTYDTLAECNDGRVTLRRRYPGVPALDLRPRPRRALISVLTKLRGRATSR